MNTWVIGSKGMLAQAVQAVLACEESLILDRKPDFGNAADVTGIVEQHPQRTFGGAHRGGFNLCTTNIQPIPTSAFRGRRPAHRWVLSSAKAEAASGLRATPLLATWSTVIYNESEWRR